MSLLELFERDIYYDIDLLSYLPFDDLLSLQNTCHTLKNIIEIPLKVAREINFFTFDGKV